MTRLFHQIAIRYLQWCSVEERLISLFSDAVLVKHMCD
jgi:hypothetical protein